MRVLITGAAGYVGKRLAPHLQPRFDLVLGDLQPADGPDWRPLDVTRLEYVVAACEGTGVVIGAPELAGTERVRSLTAGLAKGLEFDLVVIVDAEELAPVDRYVAMTRATQRLVLLTR